jgi:hypothetical protein
MALKEQAAQEIAAVRKALTEKTAALKANERRLRAVEIREGKNGKSRQDSFRKAKKSEVRAYEEATQ